MGKKQKKITMGRGEFKAYMCNVINNADPESYERLSDLFLIATGVIDSEGNLTEAFEKSPYWKVDEGVFKPSDHAQLIADIANIANKVSNG